MFAKKVQTKQSFRVNFLPLRLSALNWIYCRFSKSPDKITKFYLDTMNRQLYRHLLVAEKSSAF